MLTSFDDNDNDITETFTLASRVHGTDSAQDVPDCPCDVYGLPFDAFKLQGLSHLSVLKFHKSLRREAYTLTDQ